MPGDPAELLLSTGGITPDPAAVAELRERLGLDRPILQQYLAYLANLARGDLGLSLVDDHPVAAEIALRLPRTLELIAAGTLIALLVGIPAGLKAAHNPGGWFDRTCSAAAALLLAVPVFVLGTLLVLLFAVRLKWLPAGGYTPFARDPLQHLLLLSLPAIVIGKGLAAVIFRMTRASVLDVLSRDHVRTARAKGLGERRIMMLHVLYNALGPVLTVIGLHMGALLGGTVLVEYVFNWPGLSTPLYDPRGRGPRLSDGGRHRADDSGLFLLINLIVDLLRALLDPRLGQADGEAAARACSGPRASCCCSWLSRWRRRFSACRTRSGRTSPTGWQVPCPARRWGATIRPRRPFPAALGRAHQPLRRLRLGDDRGAGRHADRRGVRLAQGSAGIPGRAARRHHPLLSADPAGMLAVTIMGPGVATLVTIARDPLTPGSSASPRRDHRRALAGLRRRCRSSWRRPDAHRLAHAACQHREPPAGAIFADRRRGDRGRERPLFLGLGVIPPTPSWGLMIRGGRARRWSRRRCSCSGPASR